MGDSMWWGLLGVFAGALPWLEAVVVIPGGIVAGLPPVPVFLAGVTGNLITVAVAAFVGDRLRTGLDARRSRRAAARGEAPDETARRAARRRARRDRVERIMNRGGLPLLALLSPIGLGTQVSALVAVAAGIAPVRSFAWIGAGTVLWCVLAAVATVAGFAAFR